MDQTALQASQQAWGLCMVLYLSSNAMQKQLLLTA